MTIQQMIDTIRQALPPKGDIAVSQHFEINSGINAEMLHTVLDTLEGTNLSENTEYMKPTIECTCCTPIVPKIKDVQRIWQLLPTLEASLVWTCTWKMWNIDFVIEEESKREYFLMPIHEWLGLQHFDTYCKEMELAGYERREVSNE